MQEVYSRFYFYFAGLIAACILWNVIPICECLKTWTITNIAGGYTNVGRISSFNKRSLSQCAVECYMVTTCTYFGYANGGGHCVLHDYTFWDASEELTSSSVFLQYYQVACDNAAVADGFSYAAEMDGCVKQIEERKTFPDAVDACANLNAALPHTTTQARIDYISSHRTRDGTKFWVGGSRFDNNSDWYWLEGERIENQSNGGQLWLFNQANEFGDCLAVRYKSDLQTSGLVNRNCSEVHMVLCVK